jgi:hypothetical protein
MELIWNALIQDFEWYVSNCHSAKCPPLGGGDILGMLCSKIKLIIILKLSEISYLIPCICKILIKIINW